MGERQVCRQEEASFGDKTGPEAAARGCSGNEVQSRESGTVLSPRQQSEAQWNKQAGRSGTGRATGITTANRQQLPRACLRMPGQKAMAPPPDEVETGKGRSWAALYLTWRWSHGCVHPTSERVGTSRGKKFKSGNQGRGANRRCKKSRKEIAVVAGLVCRPAEQCRREGEKKERVE